MIWIVLSWCLARPVPFVMLKMVLEMMHPLLLAMQTIRLPTTILAKFGSIELAIDLTLVPGISDPTVLWIPVLAVLRVTVVLVMR